MGHGCIVHQHGAVVLLRGDIFGSVGVLVAIFILANRFCEILILAVCQHTVEIALSVGGRLAPVAAELVGFVPCGPHTIVLPFQVKHLGHMALVGSGVQTPSGHFHIQLSAGAARRIVVVIVLTGHTLREFIQDSAALQSYSILYLAAHLHSHLGSQTLHIHLQRIRSISGFFKTVLEIIGSDLGHIIIGVVMIVAIAEIARRAHHETSFFVPASLPVHQLLGGFGQSGFGGEIRSVEHRHHVFGIIVTVHILQNHHVLAGHGLHVAACMIGEIVVGIIDIAGFQHVHTIFVEKEELRVFDLVLALLADGEIIVGSA